jgi:hypothetical protein
MKPHRFSRAIALSVLSYRANRIANDQRFNLGNGTAQLVPRGPISGDELEAVVSRAVEYGRMRAFEQFAEAIEDGFQFEVGAENDNETPES